MSDALYILCHLALLLLLCCAAPLTPPGLCRSTWLKRKDWKMIAACLSLLIQVHKNHNIATLLLP